MGLKQKKKNLLLVISVDKVIVVILFLSLHCRYWASGQPNSYNGKDQDCGEFTHRSTKLGDWNDEICDRVQEWICEK